jgi:hypothetical protein
MVVLCLHELSSCGTCSRDCFGVLLEHTLMVDANLVSEVDLAVMACALGSGFHLALMLISSCLAPTGSQLHMHMYTCMYSACTMGWHHITRARK